MRVILTAFDLWVLFKKTYGEDTEIELVLSESEQLWCEMHNQSSKDIKKSPIYKSRRASFVGFSALLTLIDKRISPSRLSTADTTKEEAAIQAEIAAENI